MFLVNMSLGVILVFIGVSVLYLCADIFIPLVIAICFWYIINILAKGFSRLRLVRYSLPRFWCFVFAIGLAVLILFSMLKLISSNVKLVAEAAPVYQRNFEVILPRLMAFFGLEKEKTILELAHYINPGATISILVKNLTGLAGKTAVVFFYTVFLLYEQRFFGQKMRVLFGEGTSYDRAQNILRNIDAKTQRYLKVKVIISTLTGLLSYSVLRFYHVDFCEFWGILAFILNFIPYLGSIFAVALPTLISLVQFGDISVFVSVFFCLASIQILLGNILDPRLLGDTLNLSPIMIILSLAIWGTLWGIAGMFLAVPILSIIVLSLAQFPKTLPIAVLLSRTGELHASDKSV